MSSGQNRRPADGWSSRRVLSWVMTAAVAIGFIAASVVTGLASAGSVATTATSWRWSLPEGFPEPLVPSSNPMSAGKVAIGHRLFYDVRLSGNQTQSCASCHQPQLAFTDGRETSIGSTGQALPRNAPSLVGVAYHSTLTWANPTLVRLEQQMEVPLFGTNPVEMGVNDANKATVLRRISRDAWYAKRFPRVYRGQRRPVSWANVVRSIAAFQRTIIGGNSKYDRYRRGEATFTPQERRGLNLFMGEEGECSHCHGSFMFDDQDTYVGSPEQNPLFHNTGLYNLGGTGAYPEPNRGLYEFTGKPVDMGRFRAPSLRNVARTAPYMHDGSVKTLAEAVHNYSEGGRDIVEGPFTGDGRASLYKDPLIRPLHLSARKQADIVAFLTTLSEPDYSKDPQFADPFKKKGRRLTDDPAKGRDNRRRDSEPGTR